jgi:hypothetical protein
MDLQFWIYLIIGAIYLISRALKKPEQQQPKDVHDYKPDRQVRYDSTPPIEKPKQLTFEELLREITEAKQPQPPVAKPAYPKADVVNYDEEIGEEEQDLEVVNYDDRRIYNTDYEEAKRQAFARPSLEETMNVRDTDMQFGKFKVFEQKKKNSLLKEYNVNLQDREGLKKAFIMSEILKRKF